jgi:phospholipid/cholesterol/gamma-HCH transport system substrate-binding protein
MQKKSIEIAVGIFMVLSLFIFALFSAKISGVNNIYSKKSYYDVYVEFDNIGNLKLKSKVSISGVCIGRVKDIYLDKNFFYAKVCLSIEKDVNNIPDDTKASILTSGLLGDNYIDLNLGFSSEYLKHNDSIPIENTDSAIIFERLIYSFIKR